MRGKAICGAVIKLNIRAYKNGHEVTFEDKKEPYVELTDSKRYLFEIFKISYDRNKQFIINKNIRIMNLFQLVYQWEKIECEIVGYELDYLSDIPEEDKDKIPKEFRDLPCRTPIKVSEQEFRTFLSENKDGFDITDNQNVQVSGVEFL